MAAISVEKPTLTTLPPGKVAITASMTTDIHIFHSFTNSISKKIYDVKIYEFSSDVFNIVDAMGWKTAGRSPVGGLGAKVIHHA